MMAEKYNLISPYIKVYDNFKEKLLFFNILQR
jgi:hypothetical protein